MFGSVFRSALWPVHHKTLTAFKSALKTTALVNTQSNNLPNAITGVSDSGDKLSGKGHGAVLLVEKMASISDSLIGLTAQQYGPSSMLFTLYDKSFMELENVLENAASLETVMFSPFIRQRYHEHKPLSLGSIAQDISDPAFRPFVRIVGPGTNGSFQVRLSTHADDAPSFERQPDCLLSGLPITMSLNATSPAAPVREALAWLWPHGHVPPDCIHVRYADGTVVPDLDGSALLTAPDAAKGVTTLLRSNTYVPGACVVHFDGVPVRVLVNSKDAVSRGGGVGRLILRLFVLADNKFYYIAMAALLAAALAVVYIVIAIEPEPPLGPGSRVLINGPASGAVSGVIRALLPGDRARVALDRGGREVDVPLDALEALPDATSAREQR